MKSRIVKDWVAQELREGELKNIRVAQRLWNELGVPKKVERAMKPKFCHEYWDGVKTTVIKIKRGKIRKSRLYVAYFHEGPCLLFRVKGCHYRYDGRQVKTRRDLAVQLSK